MKAGKITAKIRDAVNVCFMVEGEEIKRYKNIEMPDALKELDIRDFGFNVLTDNKIEFQLHFDQGILPEEWPEKRERRTRGGKVETAVQAEETPEDSAEPEAEPMEATEAAAPEATEAEAEPMEPTEATAPEATELEAQPSEIAEVVEPETQPMEATEETAPIKTGAKRGRKPGKRIHQDSQKAAV